MKIQIALMAAVAATALAGTSMAASLNDVIQKGPAAAKVMEKNQINFATAKALGDHCIAEAASKGMGVSVVIIDQFGVISYYARGDGQGKTNTESALWKAKTNGEGRTAGAFCTGGSISNGKEMARMAILTAFPHMWKSY